MSGAVTPAVLATLFLRRPTPARLAAFRDRRVRALVAHAYARVPYYRRLLDAHGVRPADVGGVVDLARLPVTTRRALQGLAPEEILARGVKPARLLTRYSSGSSGRKLVVRRSRMESRLLAALRHRVGRRMGRRFWEKGARLERLPTSPGRGGEWRLRPLPRLGLFRDCVIDCLADPAWIAARLRAERPDVVGGFPPIVARVARAAGPDGLADLGVRRVVVGGETLTPGLRRRIGAAFAAPVYETYGTIEFGMIAWECAASGALHVCDDAVVLEVLRDGRPAAPGEAGTAVVTGFYGWAMPFIRCEVGDLVVQGAAACACGAPYATIAGVRGRMLDYFPLPGGRVVHPYQLTLPMMAAHGDWIEQYQLTQERPDRVVLRVVPATAPTAAQRAQVRALAADVLGADVAFELVLVDEIALEPSGKFRVSRSLVESPYDEDAPATGS